MKTFISAVIIGILLVSASTISDRCIKGFSDEMININKSIIEDGKKEDAQSSVLKMEKLLKERRIILAGIINHISLDEIENCITEIKGYASEGDEKEAKVRSHKLALLLKRLPEEYGVSIQNIL